MSRMESLWSLLCNAVTTNYNGVSRGSLTSYIESSSERANLGPEPKKVRYNDDLKKPPPSPTPVCHQCIFLEKRSALSEDSITRLLNENADLKKRLENLTENNNFLLEIARTHTKTLQPQITNQLNSNNMQQPMLQSVGGLNSINQLNMVCRAASSVQMTKPIMIVASNQQLYGVNPTDANIQQLATQLAQAQQAQAQSSQNQQLVMAQHNLNNPHQSLGNSTNQQQLLAANNQQLMQQAIAVAGNQQLGFANNQSQQLATQQLANQQLASQQLANQQLANHQLAFSQQNLVQQQQQQQQQHQQQHQQQKQQIMSDDNCYSTSNQQLAQQLAQQQNVLCSTTQTMAMSNSQQPIMSFSNGSQPLEMSNTLPQTQTAMSYPNTSQTLAMSNALPQTAMSYPNTSPTLSMSNAQPQTIMSYSNMSHGILPH